MRGRNQGQCSRQSNGNGISMVLSCGQKPSGEEVSVSLVYALGLRTDQTALASTRNLFLRVDNEKLEKNQRSHVPFMLLEIILAQWWHPVASSEALDLLYWEMRMVTYRRIAMAIKTASKVGVFVDCCLFACCPGGCQGNTKQVVAQWQHPVASEVALNMLHWEMTSVSPQSTAMAIEVANNGGAFVCH